MTNHLSRFLFYHFSLHYFCHPFETSTFCAKYGLSRSIRAFPFIVFIFINDLSRLLHLIAPRKRGDFRRNGVLRTTTRRSKQRCRYSWRAQRMYPAYGSVPDSCSWGTGTQLHLFYSSPRLQPQPLHRCALQWQDGARVPALCLWRGQAAGGLLSRGLELWVKFGNSKPV